MRANQHARPDDEQTLAWLKAAAAGDQDAWTALYQAHRSLLKAVVSQRIPAAMRSRFDTEDLLQSAFLSFSRQAGTLQIDSAKGLRRYLVEALVNKLRDRLRENGTQGRAVGREQRLETAEFSEHPSDDPSVVDVVHAAERQASMLAAIDRLDPVDQDFIWWRFIDNRTWAEIAELSGLAQTTAKRRVEEALEALMRVWF